MNTDNGCLHNAPSLDELVRNVRNRFQQQFGRPPRWTVAAPGRVNLIGEHTDYNDGFVLPMAIDRYVVMVGDRAPAETAASNGALVRVVSDTVDELSEFWIRSGSVERTNDWTNYVRGVFAGFLARNVNPGALDVCLTSSVPVGGGLSSSAALEVATATLLEAATGHELDLVDKAFLCQKAEHEYAGVPCGIMDQFTSVLGQPDHLMLLDCRSTETEMVPLTDGNVTVLIINSNVKHELTGGEYAERRKQCEISSQRLQIKALRDTDLVQLEAARHKLDDVLYRRAHHVVGENERTVQAASAIGESDWPTVGRLMYASHASLRDDYEVSCSELDILVELAAKFGESNGVIGARMTGGGFGGCAVALVKTAAVASVAESIHSAYHQQTSIEPTLFVSRPARGAHVIGLE